MQAETKLPLFCDSRPHEPYHCDSRPYGPFLIQLHGCPATVAYVRCDAKEAEMEASSESLVQEDAATAESQTEPAIPTVQKEPAVSLRTPPSEHCQPPSSPTAPPPYDRALLTYKPKTMTSAAFQERLRELGELYREDIRRAMGLMKAAAALRAKNRALERHAQAGGFKLTRSFDMGLRLSANLGILPKEFGLRDDNDAPLLERHPDVSPDVTPFPSPRF